MCAENLVTVEVKEKKIPFHLAPKYNLHNIDMKSIYLHPVIYKYIESQAKTMIHKHFLI